MNRNKNRATLYDRMPRLAFLLLLMPGLVLAQVPVDDSGIPLDAIDTEDGAVAYADSSADDTLLLSAGELTELVGPVALYPDDLLAIVLPASTYPLEIVQAARFLEQLESDASLQPDESWDESVVALLNYPEVVQMMDADIDWTWRLGEAVISQQEQLIAAIEDFRDQAYAAGNLKTDQYQTVSSNDGAIEIQPVDDEIIYVPYYEPTEVVVYQPRPVYYYYPRAYPVYYYPYPAGYRFSSGYFWGVTTAFTIGWHNDYLHVYHPSYWGHPYYGHYYYSHYYRRPSINVYNTWYVNNNVRRSVHRNRDGDYWRPRYRSGSRPQEQRVRNYHYPASDRNASRRTNVRNTRQQTDSGRMNLALRDRSGNAVNRSTSASRRNPGANDNTARERRSRNSSSVSDERASTERASRERSNATQRRTDAGARRNSTAGATFAPPQRSNVTVRQSDNRSRGTSAAEHSRRVTGGIAARQTANQSVQNRRSVTGANTGSSRAAVQRPAVARPAAANTTSRRASRPANDRQATPPSRTAPPRQTVQRSASRGETKAVPQRRQAAATKRQRKHN